MNAYLESKSETPSKKLEAEASSTNSNSSYLHCIEIKGEANHGGKCCKEEKRRGSETARRTRGTDDFSPAMVIVSFNAGVER